jgi:LysR family transcriptional regulator, nitrogen assimilation regulatory protein
LADLGDPPLEAAEAGDLRLPDDGGVQRGWPQRPKAAGMDLKELRYFRAVVQSGSFSRAAATLMVAQPSLSRQIQRLEHEMGVALLHRQARGVTPTDAGRLLLDRTSHIEEELANIRRTIGGLTESITGTLRLAVQSPVSFMLIPQLVKAYRAKHPDVELKLVEAFSADVIEGLLGGAMDMAIVDAPSHPSADLTVTPLWVETFRLFGHRDAPEMRADKDQPITLTEIAELPLIAACRRHAVRRLVDAALARRSLHMTPVIEADGPLMIFELVRAQLGYTVMPESVFKPYPRPDMMSRAIETPIRRTISLVTRTPITQDRAVTSLRALLIDEIPRVADETWLGKMAFYGATDA